MKFYSDENFPLRVTEELRKLGHDVVTVFEDGKANQSLPDEKVLERATELQRAVLTHNRLDFKRLHQLSSSHSGIVICTENKNRLELAKSIDTKVSEFESLESELIKIYRPN